MLITFKPAVQLTPMAISPGFGIILASTIMLVIMLCFYMMKDDLGELRKRVCSGS